jgi:ABC-type dipeptide/oligopeptide/nickel transport system ATPase component
VEHGPVDAILGAPAADYTRRLLRNTPSIEVALGRAAAPTA